MPLVAGKPRKHDVIIRSTSCCSITRHGHHMGRQSKHASSELFPFLGPCLMTSPGPNYHHLKILLPNTIKTNLSIPFPTWVFLGDTVKTQHPFIHCLKTPCCLFPAPLQQAVYTAEAVIYMTLTCFSPYPQPRDQTLFPAAGIMTHPIYLYSFGAAGAA